KEDWISLFKREARIAGRLTHPSIPRVLDAGRDAGTFFIAFESIEGQPLHEILDRGEKLSSERIRMLILDIAAALDHVHDEGVVHADLRASNVLVAEDGRAFLADFSMAQELGGPDHPLLAANVHTASPEYLAGFGYGPRSDQFALG